MHITSHLHTGFEPNSEDRKSEWRHEDKGRGECNLFGLFWNSVKRRVQGPTFGQSLRSSQHQDIIGWHSLLKNRFSSCKWDLKKSKNVVICVFPTYFIIFYCIIIYLFYFILFYLFIILLYIYFIYNFV